MSVTSLNPQLIFNGDARGAMGHYASVFGSKVSDVATFGEIPNFPVPPEAKERIIHARLPVGPGVLHFCDTRLDHEAPKSGSQHVSLNFDNAQEMQKTFDALGEGGEVEMPIQDMFWGAKFGSLTDRFGIAWMFNCPTKT